MALKKLNAEINKRAEELAVSNAELEKFAYIASHDMQEPLRMVTSFLTLLEKYKEQLEDEAKQYISLKLTVVITEFGSTLLFIQY